MQLVKPSIEFLNMTENPLQAIEIAGRTCYKSEDKITEGSAEKFVKMLIKRGHEAMIEHAHFIFKINDGLYDALVKLEHRPFIFLTLQMHGYLVSGNARAFRDLIHHPQLNIRFRGLIASLIYNIHPALLNPADECLKDSIIPDGIEEYKGVLSTYEKLHHQVMTCKIVCDRGVTHEIVRHRLFSYAQESTRYCNYKGGVTFVIPPWVDIEEGEYDVFPASIRVRADDSTAWWWSLLDDAEEAYKKCLCYGWTPQQARSVLPNSLKTEIVVTGNLRQWRHFFKLRCSPKAHPQMQEVANMVLADMQKRVPVIFDC